MQSSVSSGSPGSSGSSEELPRATLLLYAAPSAGFGFMFFFTSMYLMKYATDVLGVAPAAMGVIFLISRVWDGISDPIAGYLSDRTQTRIGRRRPWLLAGAIPSGLLFVLLWSPPLSLSASETTLWMGVVVVLFYSAMTIFGMPHDSLGAELSQSYSERNRVFGFRRISFGVGAIPGLFAIGWVATSDQPRSDVLLVVAAAAFVSASLMLATGFGIRERPEYQGRGATHLLGALRDVASNPHARLLMAVFLLQQLAIGSVTVMTPYFAEYVLRDAGAMSWVLGGFFVASLAAIPGWIWLGRRFEKKALIVTAMVIAGGALLCMGLLGPGDVALTVLLAALGGVAGGGLDVLSPSLQADVIDYDELQSGQRKEGVYFAAWHVMQKSAVGVAGMFVGFALANAGYQAGVEQGPAALGTMRALMSVIPFVCYSLGALLFLRFGLTQDAHQQVRTALAARESGSAAPL